MANDLMEIATARGFGEFHIKIDESVGLQAIIAIHSTKLGPALGGCRVIDYPNTEAAFEDAMRLARAMSFKSALVDLPHGGGKAVLIKPKVMRDREAYFKSYGQFVEQINGRYITAVDSGSTTADMDVINTQTNYVTSTSKMTGNTSYFTAMGVLHGISASVKHQLKTDSLKGLRVAIQGLGNVGYLLAEELYKQGAKLWVTDINPAVVEKAVDQLNATPVSQSEIYQVDCDIFAPCALGAILHEETIAQLKAKIVAGCANNQLLDARNGLNLHQNGILYAPDYVINAGGLIYAAGKYDHMHDDIINEKLSSIYHSLLNIFELSNQNNKPTSQIAEEIALAKLAD